MCISIKYTKPSLCFVEGFGFRSLSSSSPKGLVRFFAEMMFFRGVSRSLNGELSHQRLYLSNSIRSMCILTGDASSNYSEGDDDFTKRVFGKPLSNGPSKESFYRKIDEQEKALNRDGGGSGSKLFMDGLDTTFSTLQEQKLKKAATYFDINPDEINGEDYTYRPDMTFRTQDTYETKDLDLTKPGVHRPAKRQGFEVTTKEVLERADFRNPLFLANFITEAGIIIKRSQTKISAKAQRKVAREIKTARAFGLMPFTTMGQYPFIAGGNRENLDEKEDMEINIPFRFVESDPIAVPDPIVDPDI